MRDPTNPLRQGLPLTSKNIFIDIVNFALTHNKELIFTILCLTTDTRVIFDKSAVISTAKLLIAFGSSFSSNKNSTFAKLQGVVLQACGLNEVGLQALAKQGESVQVRTLLNTRTDLAIKDEENVRKVAKKSSIAVVLDNLDREVKKVLVHKTLPVLLCRNIPDQLDSLDGSRKSLEEAASSFTPDFFCLDTSSNKEEKDSFLKVTIIHLFRKEAKLIQRECLVNLKPITGVQLLRKVKINIEFQMCFIKPQVYCIRL